MITAVAFGQRQQQSSKYMRRVLLFWCYNTVRYVVYSSTHGTGIIVLLLQVGPLALSTSTFIIPRTSIMLYRTSIIALDPSKKISIYYIIYTCCTAGVGVGVGADRRRTVQ
jgi:hypothetical protein